MNKLARPQILSKADLGRLRERGDVVELRAGSMVLEPGAKPGCLYWIDEGTAAVVRGGVAVAMMGPGDVLAEVPFLTGNGSNVGVLALRELRLLRVPKAAIEALAQAEPELGSRLYRALGVVLARRLDRAAERLARLETGRPALASAAAGDLGAGSLPEPLAKALDEVEEEARRLEKQLAAGAQDARAAEAVAALCERVASLAGEWTAPARVHEVGYGQQLAFESAEALRAALGRAILRSSFRLLMASATLSRAFTKPLGFAEDYGTASMLEAGVPGGAGALGRHVDAWFLGRPFARSRRAARAAAREALRAAIAAPASAGASGPRRVTCLASGTFGELIEVLGEAGRERASGVGCSMEPERLRRAQAYVAETGTDVDLALLWLGEGGIAADESLRSLEPQHHVSALLTFDYVSDDEAVALLDRAHELLAPGGTAFFSAIAAAQADVPLLAQVLDWRVAGRGADQLRALGAQSRFGEVEVAEIAGGDALAVRCRKAGGGL